MEAKFNKLEAFQEVNGNLNVLKGHELYAWTYDQRTAKKNHKLSDERIALLDGLGFEWNLKNAQWTTKFNKLAAFKTDKGHLNLPPDHELYTWTSTQRTFKSNNKLSDERIASLEGLGFEWDPRNATWTTNFNKLKAYQIDKGHLNLPRKHELYAWTTNQRSAKNNPKSNHKLNDEKIGLLDGLGFEW